MNLISSRTGIICDENGYIHHPSQHDTSMQNVFPPSADTLEGNQSINQHVLLSQGSTKMISKRKNWREIGLIGGVRKTMRGIGIRRRKKYKF